MKKLVLTKILFILLLVFNLALGSYLIYRIFTLEDKEANRNVGTTEKETLKEKIVNKVEDKIDVDWVQTDFMGAYTFEYPKGWHVGNIWPQDYSMPITVAINKEPINTAPRGGPLAEIVFTDKSGLTDPQAYFEERYDHYNNEYFIQNDVEILDAPIGKIYHWTGQIEFYEETKTNEAYLFMLKGRIKDNVNTHIIEATGNPFSNKYSDLLKHIMLSFEPI